MIIEKNPVKITEDFYNNTFIPLTLYDFRGTILYKGGNHDDFGNIEIIDNLFNAMTSNSKEIYQSLTLIDSKNLNYTASYIGKIEPKTKFIILGPYSNEDLNRINSLPYCYFNELFLTSKNSTMHKCPVNGCQGCFSLHTRKAINYIHANYRDPITLDQVVNIVNLNKSYFITLFKKETGYTFTHYINNLRVEKSKYKLINSNNSILDIALSVGFTNQNYFSIIFKKLTSLSPLQYRKYNSL